MAVSFFVGWAILIASWVVPAFIKEEKNKSAIGLILSALATGIFVGHLVDYIFS